MGSHTVPAVTTYHCDRCGRSLASPSEIFGAYEVPLRAMDGGVCATEKFDLCEGCANLIAAEIRAKKKESENAD